MYFTIDYKTITSRDEELCDKWNDLENQIISNTEFCLKCMGLAMHQYIMNEYETKHKESEEGSIQKKSLGIIRARLINYEPIQQIKDIRVNNYGKFYFQHYLRYTYAFLHFRPINFPQGYCDKGS